MTATTVVPLGPSTLIRKWRLDVNTGTQGAPTWAHVAGLTDFKFALDPTMKDDTDLDSSGWKSESSTAMGWAVEAEAERKVQEAAQTQYNPGQEFLRTKSLLIGLGNHVEIRFYEMTSGGPKVEAYRGYAAVSWSEDGGGMDALASVSVTLTGQGQRTAITHPDGAAVVPVLYSVTPAVGVQAGGTMHRLYGAGFFAAGVANVLSMKLGVTDVPKFIALSDSELVFLAPAKTAAAFVIYVTNTVGESATATVTLTIT